MKYRSAFDIIGPIMIGPSSSHTAGAVRIGLLARKIFQKKPEQIRIHFYGSFAQTYQGHATDVAILGGLLAFETDDERIRDAKAIAKRRGIEVVYLPEEAIPAHPNTVMVELIKGETHMEVTGISVGGGAVEITKINDFPIALSGESPAILVTHRDAYGAVASVTNLLAVHHINICHMEMSRSTKGGEALMVIETDDKIPNEVACALNLAYHVTNVVFFDAV